MNRRAYRPGPGWRHVGGAVWEHKTGVRIHTLGLARMPGDLVIMETAIAHRNQVPKFIRINGGNRRRGLMAWALNEYRTRLPYMLLKAAPLLQCRCRIVRVDT